MGLTTANRDRNQDLTLAYNRVRDYPGSDISDVAAVLGSGTRYAREIVGLLITVGLLDEEGTNGFGVASDTEDVVAWVQEYAPKTPESKVVPQGSNPLCKCACGATTNHPQSLYRPGHDARHAGQVARAIVAGQVTVKAGLEQLPSDALRVKTRDLVLRWQGKAEAKGKKAATGVEYGAHEDVKRGRWTYPARLVTDHDRDISYVERNVARDGSGEWVRFG